LSCGAEKSIRAVEKRLSRETRDDGAAIDAVAQAHQALFTDQAAQRTEHLILAAEIPEFTRKEYVVAPLPIDVLYREVKAKGFEIYTTKPNLTYGAPE
jgi:hypothetical protein